MYQGLDNLGGGGIPMEVNKMARLETSTDVRRYLNKLITRVEAGEISESMANTLSNLAYKLEMSIMAENKEKEIKAQLLLTKKLGELEVK